MGHILGLAHPDAVESEKASNVYSSLLASNEGMRPMNETTCRYPWDAVVDGVWPDATDVETRDDGLRVRSSMMGALRASGTARPQMSLADRLCFPRRAQRRSRSTIRASACRTTTSKA